jgi:hypothetical protein
VLLVEPVIGAEAVAAPRLVVSRGAEHDRSRKTEGGLLEAPKDRLLRMRDEEFVKMVRRGQLPRIAAIDAALAALDEALTEWEPASRAMVTDDGQTTIRMTLYDETGAVAAVELSPVRAVGIAAELIEAALSRLSGE